MATFVEIQTDAFANNIHEQAQASKRDFTGVRRPVRGIEIKEDTYSIMKVIRADGTEIALTDAGGGHKAQSGSNTGAGSGVDPTNDPSTSNLSRKTGPHTYNYSNFIIQRIEESRQEKQQIMETFGETFIFFFGERPRLLQVTGLLMNTLDFNWRTEFWHNYENTLRGTRLVEQNARLYLFWDDIVVEGYILGAQARDDSEMPYHIPFSFSMFVTNHMFLSNVGSDDYPITAAVNLEPLLRQKDAELAKRELKASVVQSKRIVSTTEAVREAAEQARISREGESSWLESATGQKVLAGKDLLSNALILGLNAQNMTFLSIANHFFRNRKMRFPRGLGGSEAYTGEAKYANFNVEWDQFPQRTKPLRSKIRDNVDEYIHSGVVGWEGAVNIDKEAVTRAQQRQQHKSGYELEKKALQDLEDMGIEPIQHPGGSLLDTQHAIDVLPSNLVANLSQFGLA